MKPPPYVEQVGSLFILLPHSYGDTKAFAFHVARMVADRITFQQGDFRILSGLIACKRIAETPEEEAEFGENLYNIEAHLVEVVAAPTFDSSQITKTPSSPQHLALSSQFNETKRDKSSIRQFLGYFRILESVCHTSDDKIPLKQRLLASAALRGIHDRLVNHGDYETLIAEFVEIRHKCAHLRLEKGFGYAPADPAVERNVKPHLPLLEAMAHCSIMGPEATSQ